jgi:hypothetical protein
MPAVEISFADVKDMLGDDKMDAAVEVLDLLHVQGIVNTLRFPTKRESHLFEVLASRVSKSFRPEIWGQYLRETKREFVDRVRSDPQLITTEREDDITSGGRYMTWMD